MVKLIAFILSGSILFLVIELIRREKLTFKYALAWLFIACLGVLCSIFPEIIFTVSKWCGFTLPSNFIFFSLICIFVFLSLLLTVFLCQQNSRNDRLVQQMALLEHELNQLKERANE